jgi:oxaloacetate decarboxylase alpha subunit
MATNTDGLTYQLPGGMLSNLIAQLKAQNSLDRFEEALAEVPNVRRDWAIPAARRPVRSSVYRRCPTCSPASWYKNVSNEVKAYLRGEYGRRRAR